MGEYVGMKVCDLRFIHTVEEAKGIEEIVDVELLVLPNDAPEDVARALAAIPKIEVNQVIQLGSHDELDVSKYIKKTVTYQDTKILDLRSITTVEAAEAVKEIKRVKVLIVPADGPEEVRNAIMGIRQKEIGKVLRLRLDEEADYSKLEEEIDLNEKYSTKYSNMDILDMRNFKSIEGIQKIRLINDVAVLVLPADAPPEIMSALISVPKKNIVKTIYLKDGEEIPYGVQRTNGIFTMTSIPQKNTVILVNGICMIPSLTGLKEGVSITLQANGLCLLHPSLKNLDALELSINGMSFYKEFEPEKIKMFNEMDVDAATVSYLPEGTFLIAGHKLSFADDVTPEMLIEKKIQLLVGGKISSPKHLIPYLNATATVGDKIVEKNN